MLDTALKMPDIGCYGSYSGNNYGFHALYVDFGPVTVWFSYTTPVAFQVNGVPRIVSRNYWSRTTGKHLTWIDGGNKATRVSEDTFKEEWSRQVAPFFDEDAVLATREEEPRTTENGNGRLPVQTRKLFPLPKLKLNRD